MLATFLVSKVASGSEHSLLLIKVGLKNNYKMLKPFLFLNEMVIKIGHRRNYLSSIPFMFLDIPDLKELETRLQIKLFYVKRIIYNGNEMVMVMKIRHRRNHLPSIHFMFLDFPDLIELEKRLQIKFYIFEPL